jgi:polysaccharide pyruvyl transferase WcaK-like protein
MDKVKVVNILVAAAEAFDQGRPRNLGDQALGEALRTYLSEREDVTAVRYTASCRCDDATSHVHTRDLPALLAAVRWADLIVFGGGTLIDQDRAGFLAGHVRLLATVAGMAAATRTAYAFLGVGAEPLRGGFQRLLFGRVVRGARLISARDEFSKRVIEGLADVVVHIGADTFLLDNQDEPVCDTNRRPGRPCLALRADALQRVDLPIENDVEATLVATDQGVTSGDVAASLAACQQLGWLQPYRLGEMQSWRELAGHMSAASVVISDRMHALYIAASSGTPALGVNTRGKVERYCAEFDVPMLAVGDIGLGVAGSIPGRLPTRAAIDRATGRLRRDIDLLLEEMA